MKVIRCWCLAAVGCLISTQWIMAQESKSQEAIAEMPMVYSTDFAADDQQWEMLDPASWQFTESGTLNLHLKASAYQPKFRSPLHIALLKNRIVTSFELNVKIKSTEPDYNHRDACLFFGFQSPTQYYYVHLGKKADPHANQIFIVNNAARMKISLTTTEGTAWDDQYHQVRLCRDAGTGDIKVFFDDMQEPVMMANDKTFLWGRVGVGSFDDRAEFDDLRLNGQVKK